MGNATGIFCDWDSNLVERIGRQVLIPIGKVKHSIGYDRAFPVDPADLIV